MRWYAGGMAKRLAVMTFGHLVEPFGHPAVQGFVDIAPRVMEAADHSKGFIARYDDSKDMVVPQCWGGELTNATAPTLSLWTELEAAVAYAYRGLHREAMQQRREWFVQNDLPGHVAWWIDDPLEPTWEEAALRMDHFYENGPSAFAFTLKRPFDRDGNPTKIDASVIRLS